MAAIQGAVLGVVEANGTLPLLSGSRSGSRLGSRGPGLHLLLPPLLKAAQLLSSNALGQLTQNLVLQPHQHSLQGGRGCQLLFELRHLGLEGRALLQLLFCLLLQLLR